MHDGRTIAAPATPDAPAARAIVRVSGPLARSIVASMTGDERWDHRSAEERSLRLGDDWSVPTTILMFAGPRSATGEDVAEFHLPGSPFLVSRLMARLLALGCRLAEPGEFTSRAFFNGKLDLAAAEGVAATIAAGSRGELSASRQLLAGELARRLRPIEDRLVALLAGVEAELDFADEPIDSIANEVAGRASEIAHELRELLANASRIERLDHEPRVVLVGRPNAGKSTLLNALAGQHRATISDVPGTTRDPLSARAALPSGMIQLIDTAGFDETPGEMNAAMQAASRRAIETADLLVVVRRAIDPRLPIETPAAIASIEVRTHADLTDEEAGETLVSAVTGAGLDALRRRLDRTLFRTEGLAGGGVALNARHRREMESAIAPLNNVARATDRPLEVVASSLRAALDHLGAIGGRVSPDDVLGRIFSAFCIGK